MNSRPQKTREALRLARLANYRILDSRPDTAFDHIVRLAALAMDAPRVALGVLDADRVWFKARIGTEATEIPRSGALCENLLEAAGPVVVPDTLADPATRDAPMVREKPHIRFYVGIPLRSHDGVHLGSLCIMDMKPRPVPTDAQMSMLRELAAMAVEEIELRAIRTDGAEQTQAARAEMEGGHRNLLAAYAAKSEFLASLSHELRTPLNAIVGYAGLIAGSDDTPTNTADHAGEITAAARHMLALVNDILEYSRLEAGNIPIGWQRVMVGPIVEASLHMVAVFAASRGIRVIRDIAWADAVVRGDPVRLKQVLLNLLTNAIKFTPRGGNVTMRLAAGVDGRMEITVADTGIGIAPEDIPKTLTPFGQIVPKAGAQIEGTGLGLPIAKALIERQGGGLNLESVLGQGTTVRIWLPALHPARVAADAGTPATP